MEHTKNYSLPQWAKEDRIMMEDFNQMCVNIENGIDTARAEAKQASEEAAVLPYAVGSYTGNGQAERFFSLGFHPRFVIICHDQAKGSPSVAGIDVVVAGPTVNSGRLFLLDDGFRITLGGSSTPYPKINEYGQLYDYIAFR